jgi:hypothetical protein
VLLNVNRNNPRPYLHKAGWSVSSGSSRGVFRFPHITAYHLFIFQHHHRPYSLNYLHKQFGLMFVGGNNIFLFQMSDTNHEFTTAVDTKISRFAIFLRYDMCVKYG